MSSAFVSFLFFMGSAGFYVPINRLAHAGPCLLTCMCLLCAIFVRITLRVCTKSAKYKLVPFVNRLGLIEKRMENMVDHKIIFLLEGCMRDPLHHRELFGRMG